MGDAQNETSELDSDCVSPTDKWLPWLRWCRTTLYYIYIIYIIYHGKVPSTSSVGLENTG